MNIGYMKVIYVLKIPDLATINDILDKFKRLVVLFCIPLMK